MSDRSLRSGGVARTARGVAGDGGIGDGDASVTTSVGRGGARQRAAGRQRVSSSAAEGGGGCIDMDADMDVSADNVFEIIERCRRCLIKHTPVNFRKECDEVLMVCIEILATQRLIGITSFFNCQVKELLNKIRNEQILASECAFLLKGCMLFQIAVMHCNIYNIEA